MQTETVINHLKEVYTGDKFNFDFQVSMLIAGDSNKSLRQDIVLKITGEKKPLSKCGMYAVADILRANFDQLALF